MYEQVADEFNKDIERLIEAQMKDGQDNHERLAFTELFRKGQSKKTAQMLLRHAKEVARRESADKESGAAVNGEAQSSAQSAFRGSVVIGTSDYPQSSLTASRATFELQDVVAPKKPTASPPPVFCNACARMEPFSCRCDKRRNRFSDSSHGQASFQGF